MRNVVETSWGEKNNMIHTTEMCYTELRKKVIGMCAAAELELVLKKTRDGLHGIFGTHLLDVMLYGSYARGEQQEESDIDVFALVDLNKEDLIKYRRAVSQFSSDIDLEHDVLLSIKLQDAETFYRYGTVLPFFKNVMKEGIRIVQ